MAGTRLAAFTTALREYQLLAPEQLDELEALQTSIADLRALAQELVKRGWLTVFQANQLLQGNGRDLVLGPYRILDRLGAGGMGQVFKARHRRMDRLVALKVINQEYLTNSKAVQRFERECRTAAQLSHPNIVLAHDADQVGEVHFLAMEYVDGTDLSRLVKQCGALEVSQACRYVRQAALGLQHAHEQGVVHRDIKPANLMMTRAGPGAPAVIKILDFGLARFESEKAHRGQLTTLGNLTGTVDYIAPEQIHDASNADIRADIHSLGCTLCYLLTAKPPFPGDDMMVRLSGRLHAPPPSARARRPEVPPQLDEVLAKMMARDPTQRYQTPAEVAAALEPFARKRKSSLPPPLPPADTMAGQVVDLEPRLKLSRAVSAAHPATEAAPPLDARRRRRGGPLPGSDALGESAQIQAATRDEVEEATATGSALPRAPARGRWRLAVTVAAALVFLAGGVLLTLWAWRGEPAPQVATSGGGPEPSAVKPPPPQPVIPPPPAIDPRPRVAVLFADGSKDDFNTQTDRSMRFGVVTVNPVQPQGSALKKLTYSNRGTTNSTVVRVDKKDFTFGAQPGRWEIQAEKVGTWGGMKSVWLLDPGLRVTQTVAIVPGEAVEGPAGTYRRLLDTCLIRYTLENRDGQLHSVGLRVLVDTLIGTNDGVPFTVPGLPGVVDTFHDFAPAKMVPDFLQALEVPDLTRPGTVAQMNFKLGRALEPPGRVSLTLWPKAAQYAWTVPVVPMKEDSAVVIYWNTRKLKPGDKRELGFSYGLGHIATSGGALGVSVGGSFAPGGDLTVLALVSNPQPKQTVTLKLPAGIALGEGIVTQPVPPAGGGRPGLVTWRVRTSAAGTFSLGVVSSTGIEQTKTIVIADNPPF